MADNKEFVKSLIKEIQEYVDGKKRILLREPTSKYSVALDPDATDEEKENAKEALADHILSVYDVVTDESSGEKSLKRKEL